MSASLQQSSNRNVYQTKKTSFAPSGADKAKSLSSPKDVHLNSQRMEKVETKEVYEDVEAILSKTVDEIWEMFDDDGNGTFDIDETTAFIKHTLTEMGENPEYSEQDFMQCFI